MIELSNGREAFYLKGIVLGLLKLFFLLSVFFIILDNFKILHLLYIKFLTF